MTLYNPGRHVINRLKKDIKRKKQSNEMVKPGSVENYAIVDI
jgi:hypothetical protein